MVDDEDDAGKQPACTCGMGIEIDLGFIALSIGFRYPVAIKAFESHRPPCPL